METTTSKPIRWPDTFNVRSNFGFIYNFALIAILFVLWLISSFFIYLHPSMPFILWDGDAEAVFVAAMLGLFLSRWAISALLLVLLPGNFSFRLGFAILLFAGEVLLVSIFGTSDSSIAKLLVLPVILVCLAVPFEVFRIMWDGRLEVDWFDSVENQKLGIKGLFYRVTAAAILFGILRLCDYEIALTILAYSTALVGVGLFFVLPISIKFLNSRYRFFWFVASLFVCSGVAYGLSTVVAITFLDPYSWFPLVATAFTVSLILFYTMALALLLRLGIELKIGGRDRWTT